MKKKYLWLVLLPLLCVFGVSCWMIGSELLTGKHEADAFASLAAALETFAPETTTRPASQDPSDSAEPTEPEPIHKRNIASLTAKNPDCVAWLSFERTPVDYPVMYTPAEPQKYLRLNFDGDEYSHSGVPFLDERCTLDGSSLIVYGHNMKNGTMFSTLCEYIDAAYLTAHPSFEFETAAGCKTYRIFAVALVEPTDEWYDSPVADAAELEALLQNVTEKSVYATGITPQAGRQLVTLSTCYYGGSGDERLLVLGYECEAADGNGK